MCRIFEQMHIMSADASKINRAAPRTRRKAPARRALVDPGGVVGARRTDERYRPRFQLATRVDRAPEGPGWIHEIKFDGYRLMCVIASRAVTLFTRGGQDWTARFPQIASELRRLRVDDAALDGEIIAVDARGRSDFSLLQQARRTGATTRLLLQVFDVPRLGGWDLSRTPLIERKRILKSLVAPLTMQSSVRFSTHHVGDGAALHTRACAMRLEGIISKRVDSPYLAGRTRSWVKSKCGEEQEFVIGGFTPPQGDRAAFGSLLLGFHQRRRLIYAGKVGSGFDRVDLTELHARLRRLTMDTCPFHPPPEPTESRGATWVRPTLVAQVRFAEWTTADRLRQPVFIGLREDKAARDVRRERSSYRSAPKPPVAVAKPWRKARVRRAVGEA